MQRGQLTIARCKHSCYQSCPRKAIIKEREKLREMKYLEMTRPLLKILYTKIFTVALLVRQKGKVLEVLSSSIVLFQCFLNPDIRNATLTKWGRSSVIDPVLSLSVWAWGVLPNKKAIQEVGHGIGSIQQDRVLQARFFVLFSFVFVPGWGVGWGGVALWI